MNYLRKTDLILFFIAASQLPQRQLLRCLGYSYDFTGRIINRLLEENYIEIKKLEKPYDEKYITLTSKGSKYIEEKYPKYKAAFRKIKKRIKGQENKNRQFKIACVMEMFNSFFPEHINQFLELQNGEAVQEGTPKQFDKYTDIRNEINKRKKDSSNGYILLTREMRDIDESGLKNLTSARAIGIVNFGKRNYVIYNHNKKKMRSYGDFEERYSYFIENLLGEPIKNSFCFMRSYTPLINSLIHTEPTNENTYILNKKIYENQFCIPLTYQGLQQLKLFQIENFREKVKKKLLSSAEINRAQLTIYDGVAESGNLIYLGFESNFNEIETIMNNMQTIHINKNIQIYCFPHQSQLYEELFGNRAEINTIDMNTILKYI